MKISLSLLCFLFTCSSAFHHASFSVLKTHLFRNGFFSSHVLKNDARKLVRGHPSFTMSLSELVGNFQIGDRVRVTQESITLFHVKAFPDGYLIPVGKEGEIFKIILTDPKSGKPVSPNRPLVVKFDEPKFQAHFEARELEKVA